ncbi:2-amino-4-hydroxy-6-hydroxymethyldihydropteridine diphosphokinase [Aliikangiella maris]|uniref:2-amino-4-hydroxy-6-hydroxymethyldihydropteridine diphosphokinase n=2 Tax=Aliikangiella maris TaxID=3162458 RepID=A0ABV3MLI4_9GAMM
MYLGIGSNIEPALKISQAKSVLENSFQAVCFSATYISQAVGFAGDDFHNLVAKIETQLSLEALSTRLKQIEDQLGRVRGGKKFSSRHIDIDILLYGELVSEEPIVLPRPEIHENAYVLCPLAELAPDLVEPGGSLTYAQLWDTFDQSRQKLIRLVE